jgi:hypothetical protein
MPDRKWWMLNQFGNPFNPEAFPPRPEGAVQSDDPCHPWHHTESHLHEEANNLSGIHMFGTLIEVRAELERAKLRRSPLPIK